MGCAGILRLDYGSPKQYMTSFSTGDRPSLPALALRLLQHELHDGFSWAPLTPNPKCRIPRDTCTNMCMCICIYPETLIYPIITDHTFNRIGDPTIFQDKFLN